MTNQVLPKAVGWTILLKPKDTPGQTKGGIWLSDQTKELSRLTAVVAQVLDMGPDAYSDKERYVSGPYCKVGDWILIAMYAGSRFKVNGEEYRFINEDQVRGVVPESIVHQVTSV